MKCLVEPCRSFNLYVKVGWVRNDYLKVGQWYSEYSDKYSPVFVILSVRNQLLLPLQNLSPHLAIMHGI